VDLTLITARRLLDAIEGLWYRARNRKSKMSDWRHFHFDRKKFKALMLYFSQRGVDERLVIGSTKLNKLLFFSDMRAYAELGQPITGARYQKLPFGPAARAMLPVREEMVEEGVVEFEHDDDSLTDVLTPVERPDVEGVFTEDELRIADAVFEEMRSMNARAVSDYSHLKSAGWNVVDEGEDIPWESAFVSTDAAPDEAIELGRKLAAEYNW
jgi:hypothetical protein